MNVTRCDICKKEVNDKKYVSAGVGWFPKIEACYDCGAPIVKFLKKHKIIEKEDKKS
ncbi:MAG: hypothetical protein AAB877_02235 [Patescibacteria group bacterium]